VSTPDLNEKRSLVDAVKTPLGFFTLALLVAEAIITGLALGLSGADRTFLLYAWVGITVLLILVVAAIAIFRPAALWGTQAPVLDDLFAESLGKDIGDAFGGYLENLPAADRGEAYNTLKDILNSRYAKSETARQFCETLVENIAKMAKLNVITPEVIGVIAAPVDTHEPVG
jgi:hypothetical protein